jgi:hypothetical protein
MISVAVRWYLRYGLSYQDVEELLAEHGVTVWPWRSRETAPVCGTLRTRQSRLVDFAVLMRPTPVAQMRFVLGAAPERVVRV